MKRILLIPALWLLATGLFAAWHENIPQTLTQPDGRVVNCFASGDEFYHWLHDAEGYTIVLNPEDGFFYYGVRQGDRVVPSRFVAGAVNPAATGLARNARISQALYAERRAQMQDPFKSLKGSPTRGTVNSIVIYISFADDSVFNRKRRDYKAMWTGTTSASVQDYFKTVSYNTLNLQVSHFPVSPDTVNLSYVDIFPRRYYLPKSNMNPEGYDDSEKGSREHAMLKRAVEYIAPQVPDSLDLDMNDDNAIDNISFVIRGSSSAWSDLLWPHAWSLFSFNVQLKGSRVGSYFLTMENGFGVGTICHELGHVFGAPDLYHYNDTGAPNAVGGWCLMNSSADPPQGICGFLRYNYNKWIPQIHEISESGTYTILPLSEPERNLFMIKSPFSRSEYFVLEYRKKEGRYEGQVPGTGLLVYRINPGAGRGNAGGPPDEVYLYRPNGTISVEGNLGQAPFGGSGRKTFNDKTNPGSFLWNGGQSGKGGINLSNITIYEDSVTFDVTIEERFPPTDLILTPGVSSVDLDWEPSLSDGFLRYYIYKNDVRIDSTTLSYYKDYGIQQGITYSYYITGLYTGENAGESNRSNTAVYTPLGIQALPYEEDFEDIGHGWMIKGTVEGFRYGDGSILSMTTDNTTKFLATNSVEAGENTNCIDYAITPRLNLSGRQKVNLYFDYTLKRWQQLDHLKIYFRRNPYESWIQIIDMPTSGISPGYKWRKYSLELPADAYAGEAQIGFRYDDGDGLGYGAGIDNIVVREPAVGMADPVMENTVSLYPNPVADLLVVNLSRPAEGPVSFRILSADGKVHFSEVRANPASTERFDLSRLNPGVYFFVVETSGEVILRNLVKN